MQIWGKRGETNRFYRSDSLGKHRVAYAAFEYSYSFVDIRSDCLAIANQLEGIESMIAAFYFLDMADRAIQQFAEIAHG